MVAGTGSDPDYCDGIASCIDCLDDSGCEPQRYCDLFGQICLLRAAPPPPSPPGPMGAWNEFVNALNAGDSARALTFVADTSREKYGEVFRLIAPRLGTVSSSWSTPEQVSAGSDYMTFLVVDSDNQGGTGHLVSMVLEDGRWVVDQL